MIAQRLLSAVALALALALAFAAPAFAVDPHEMLEDPQLEARARQISKDLRCLVCQNQSIDDSDAELARDLRVLVRERLKAGDSDEQARQFLVDRYGDYVLLTPPFKTSTLALWLGPPVLLLLALLAARAHLRRRRDAPADPGRPLSEEESRRVAALIEKK